MIRGFTVSLLALLAVLSITAARPQQLENSAGCSFSKNCVGIVFKKADNAANREKRDLLSRLTRKTDAEGN